MKKSDKIISTILILAILIGGGYFAAKHFGLIGGSAATIEEPQDIETVEVWNESEWDYQANNYHGENAWADFYFETTREAIDDSSATYFIGSVDENGTLVSISQTDKETFNENVKSMPTNKIIDCATTLMKESFNRDFTAKSETHKEELMTEIPQYMPNIETMINNNVKIKCESVELKKICAYDVNRPYCPAEFIIIGTAEVTTVNADGDISNTPFGNKGESVTIKFSTPGSIQKYNGYTGKYFDNSVGITVFERVD